MMRADTGEWEDFTCGTRLKSICEKAPIDTPTGGPIIDSCDDPSCCNKHIGVEYGGLVLKDSFSSSSQLAKNSRPEAGRLNSPNQLVQIGDINIKNDMTGGWMPAEEDKTPYWECAFTESVNNQKKTFYAEVKGAVTQGLDGYHDRNDAKRWTTEYQIKYELASGDMMYITDKDGSPATFKANFDKDTPIINTFPYPVLTKRIRIYLTKWHGKTGALRAEFIGCKSGCIKSLGVCQDSVVNGEQPINTVSNDQMTASSEQPGAEAFLGRISYKHQRHSPTPRDKKTWQVYVQTKNWDSSKQSCGTQPGGVGVLGTIANDQENDRLVNQLRSQNTPTDACWWIGLRRYSNVYFWDDGSELTYQNWLSSDEQKNPCVCISVKDNYKWVSMDCATPHQYVCQRTESGHVWLAGYDTANEWLMVDLGHIMKVNGIFTQGAPEEDAWVESYEMSFSDKNRDDWNTYMDHDGLSPVKFTGNKDRYTISEGVLRQPVTARYIKISPKSWYTKIALRIDIIGCKGGERVGCNDDGNSYAEHGDSFTIDCPGGCNKVTPTHVWGTHTYRMSSSICQAAIHDGKVAPDNGGSLMFNFVNFVDETFVGSLQHGIQSDDADKEDLAMVFGNGHLGCEDGWFQFRSSCYYLPRNSELHKTNWEEARVACQKLNGDLVSINDKAENDFLYSQTRSGFDFNNVWIGLSDVGHMYWYSTWVDQSPTTFTYWERNKPGRRLKESCVVAYRATWYWGDKSCGDKFNYVCERPAVLTDHIATEPGCEAGWYSFGDRCYRFVMQNKIQFWALEYCRDLGGQLATIYNDGVNAFVNSKINELAADDPHSFWIGIYGESSTANGATVLNYVWASGETIQYTNWKKGHPDASLKCVFPFKYNLKSYNDCVNDPDDPWYKIIGGAWCSATENFNDDHRFVPCSIGAYRQGCGIVEKDTGMWYTDWGEEDWHANDNPQGRGCYDVQNFVCDKMKDGFDRPIIDPPPPTQGPNCLNPQDGWDGYDGSVYCYLVKSFVNNPVGNNSKGVDFEEAYSYCQSHGANMLSLHSLDQEAEVYKLIRKKETIRSDWYFLGFSDRSSDKGYQWTDGTGVDYLNWAVGQPQKTAKAEECSAIVSGSDDHPETTGWWSTYCHDQAGFVCAIIRGSQPDVPPTFPPEKQPDAECNSGGQDGDIWWSIGQYESEGVINKKCVLIVTDQLGSEWDAEGYCQGRNGHLVTLHHISELHELQNVLRTMPDGDYWIGLKYDYDYVTYDYSWRWEDNTALNFDNWAQNEPKADTYTNDRVYLNKASGRWFSSTLYVNLPFICQRWPKGQPTPPPEEVKQGGCPTGWYPYSNRCFQYNGFLDVEASLWKNWDDASAACMLTSGSTLAVIPSYEYNAFIFAHMYGSAESVWVGARASLDREWTWADNKTMFIFGNWDAGEPNNSGGMEYCLTVQRQNSKWNDDNCDRTKPYICSMDKSPEFDSKGIPNDFNCPLEKGYQPLGSACYKIYTEEQSYSQAKQTCAANRGSFKYAGLATIWDVHDNMFLYALMNEESVIHQDDFHWIGLYFDKDQYPTAAGTKWLWEDKHSVTYSKWGNGQPIDTNDQTGCAHLKHDGFWESAPCGSKTGFFCKLEAKFDPDDHDDPGEDLCDPEWTGHGGYCYYRSVISGNWADAQQTCQINHHGANLISIHSDEDRRFLSAVDIGDSWIGLHRNTEGGFEWEDETGLDYTAWQPYEPNNGGGSGIPEECVITNGQGFWNDVPCENWNTALCRKVSEHSFCKLDYDKRDDCGWYGVEQEECISMGCCWNPTPEDVPGEWCFHPSNSVNCLNEGGQCIPNSRANNCNRGIKDSLCQNEGTSGGEQVCCLSCSSKECKDEESEWSKGDTQCVLQTGSCQFNTVQCVGSGYSYKPEYDCGGPAERQCCAPAVKVTTTVIMTPETLPPTFSPPGTPSTGSTAGQTAGIVIGVLIGCCAVVCVGYVYNQNGNPFTSQQQSFSNLNSDNNTNSVVDYFSNPEGDTVQHQNPPPDMVAETTDVPLSVTQTENLFDADFTQFTDTSNTGKKHTELPYTLLVVQFDEYKDLDLATVAQVKADSSWKSDIEEWGIASLADGKCDGSGYGFNISNHMEEYGHKVVVKYTDTSNTAPTSETHTDLLI